MADVAQTFIDNSAAREQQALLRQQRLAEFLQQQAFQPDQKFSYAGIEAPPSGAAALARGLQSGVAGYLQGRAMKGQDDLVKKTEARESKYGEDLARALAAATPGRSVDTSSMGEDGLPRVSTESKGGYEGIAAALQGINNPDVTRALGPQMTMAQIQQQQAAADRAAKLADAKELKAAPGSTSGDIPMTVKEWEYYQKLPAEKRDEFLNMKRTVAPINLGGTVMQPSPSRPGVAAATFDKTLPPEARPETRAAQAAAVQTAENEVEARAVLPRVEQNSTYLVSLLDQMAEHPGLPGVVGMPNVTGALRVPGTPEADFRSILEQVQGKQFLEAFESLKGGGAITQIEGEKAGNAIARLQTAQTEPAFKAALTEFKTIVQGGLERARAKAKAGGPKLSPVDQEAMDWANANPNDPRATAIKQRFGM